MACNRNKVGKRKDRDPELSQLLKLVLAKLGSGDSGSGDSASDEENICAESDRPRRSHVPSREVFPPVRRRNKKEVPSAQQLSSASPSTTTPPAQSLRADTLLVSDGTISEIKRYCPLLPYLIGYSRSKYGVYSLGNAIVASTHERVSPLRRLNQLREREITLHHQHGRRTVVRDYNKTTLRNTAPYYGFIPRLLHAQKLNIGLPDK
ncbi:hypothetical protein NDU88_008508 [Pleurodeles waltl]|uniref:Uncharacterized protein n=1 Tax=Pleurodeles waltl TaxID=8319 RepID=A0AAV7RSK7_PLEWA|nr:hypothetical protein NDU88_008508 [Pleurodeles waltl]